MMLSLLLGLSPEEARWVAIARAAVSAEVSGRPAPPSVGATPARPVFVTVEKGGRVLACRGGLTVRTATLESEIALAARGAAGFDPRWGRLTPARWSGASVTVTVVDSVEPLTSVSGLTPGEGLVLESGGRTGVVLPWEGRVPSDRLRWAYRKAGVPEGSSARLSRLLGRRARG